jgi:16S rRNA (adenine1518-N6/adenine1519-N6)-dimethyltransferase
VTELTRPQVVADLLRKHGLRPTKGLGQNFLVDRNALLRIVDAASLQGTETCLEIGPGLGTLTVELARLSRQVIAIEKDKKLIPVLQETLDGHPNTELIMGDALHVDYSALLSRYASPYKTVANLPYYITTPLMMSLLESSVPWERLVFLVQKEVAERILAAPGTEAYGSLTVAVQYYASAEIVAHIGPGAFFPPPKVASTVVCLTGRGDPDAYYGVHSRKTFFRTVRAGFQQRRKTLLNALSSSAFSKEAVRVAMASVGLPENIRGEVLDVKTFAELSNILWELARQ